MRDCVQHCLGAHAFFAVQQRNDAGFQLRAFQYQSPHEVGSPVAEEPATHHLDRSQSGTAAGGEHVVQPAGYQLGIARGIAEGYGELRDLQRSLNDQRRERPGAGEALVDRVRRGYDPPRPLEAVLDRPPLAVMDASLRGVKIGQREIRFVAPVNGSPVERFDLPPERLTLLQLRKGAPQLIGQRVDRGVVQP